MQKLDQSVFLRLAADAGFVPLVQGVVEQGAAVFGLGRDKTLKLVMAAEEIVSHLAGTAGGTEIDLALSNGGWCVVADFSFMADPSGLWAMNLAAREDVVTEKSMDHLGLLLASRMVDGFSVNLNGKVVHLKLRQDLDYPVMEPKPVEPGHAKGKISILNSPEAALIKEACILASALYPAHLIHESFHRPGKVVDMVAGGDVSVAVAVDATGALAGMIGWRSPSESSVSFSGPYVFLDGPNVAGALETHLLNTVARTSAASLFSDLATADLVTGNFEALGHLIFIQSDEKPTELGVWFRHLREDTGIAVWAHPAMRQFLERTYDRLVLMRTIRETNGHGEALPERSVFSARLRPELREATLSLMVAGSDVADAVSRHVEVLKRDGYLNLFFHLDLAFGWQAAIGGALMDNGFVPRLVLPHGGASDMVVFQHA